MACHPAMVIRSALPEDLDALHELDKAVFGPRHAYQYFALRQLFDLHRPCWLVAEDDAGIRGYALAVPATDSGFGWILGVAVHEDFRRRGCGRALTERAMEWLAAHGVEQARLTVEPENAEAVAMYAEAGFAVVEHQEDYFGPGEHRLIMAAKLAPGRHAAGGATHESDHSM